MNSHKHSVYLFILACLLKANISAFAFSATDANTIFSSFNSAFYIQSGTNGYFANSQTDDSATYFWGQAEMIEGVIDAYEWTTNSAGPGMITNLLNGFISDNGTTWTSWNIYNDDIMWAVIAFARGGRDTGNTNFCDLAKANFDACYARAWSTNLGGGMWWSTDNAGKNACVNGPAAIAADLLYQIYGDTNYWNKATNIYYWERSVLFNTNSGAIYDNISTNGTLNTWSSTYNQGTFIGAAHFLGQTNDATLAANYTLMNMTSGGILPEYGINGANNCGFNAIFLRWLTRFMKDRNLQGTYESWLQLNATAAWEARRPDNLSWCQWQESSPEGTNFYAWDCISSFEALQAADPTQGISSQAVPADYAGYWPLDNNATDASGNGNTGTVSGAAWNTNGQVSACLTFNGSNSVMQITNPVANDFTIAFWVKTTQTAGTGQWYNGVGLVDGDASGNANDFGTAMCGGKFAFGTGNSDTTILSTSSINNGAWHHCAATRRQATGTLCVYVDGSLQTTGTGNRNTLDATARLKLGVIASGGNYFKGSLDEVKIFARTLSSNEVAALYNSSLVIPAAAPTNLTAIAGNLQVQLNWWAAAGAISYNVKRSIVNGGPYVTLTNTAATSYTDTTVTNNQTYYYVVSAVNSAGESAQSVPVSAGPLALAAWFKADAITGLTNGAPVSLWADASGNGYGAMQLLNSNQPVYVTNALNGLPVVRFNSAKSTYLWFYRPVQDDFTMVLVYQSSQGISTGTSFWNGAGLVNGEQSGTVNDFGTSLNANGRILAGTGNPDTTIYSGTGFNNGQPHVVTFKRTRNTGAMVLYVDGTQVAAGTSGTNSLTAPNLLVLGGQGVLNNFLTGDIAEVQIYNTPLSDSDRVGVERAIQCKYSLSGGAAPAAPTGLTATLTNQQVVLNWTLTAGVTSYNLWRSTNSGSTYQLIASGLTTSSYVDSNVSNNLTNFYEVAATDGCGTSTNSAPASTVPPPPAPTGLAGTAANQQISLTWNAVTGATSYNLWRSTNYGSSYQAIATSLTTTNCVDATAARSLGNFYEVAAANNYGTSTNSAPVGIYLGSTNPAPWAMKKSSLMTQWSYQVDTNAPLPEYPRPQLVRTNWLNLNGIWQFQPGVSNDPVPVGQTLSNSILVPYPMESALSGIMQYNAWSWYRRTFTVPTNWNGQQIILHLDAVDWQSQVFVNGQSVGLHKGGYDPVCYNITPYLQSGTNELIVQVYSPEDAMGEPRGKQTLYPGGIMYTSSSGIWQPVWLEPVASTGVQNLVIIPDVDNNRLRLTVNTYATSGVTVKVAVLDNGIVVATTTGNPQTELDIPIANPKLWSPDSPFLYGLQISVVNNGVTNDTATSYFGLRKISVSKVGGVPRIFLNNQQIFGMGPLDQGFWPDGIYTAPTDAALAYDIQMEKNLGFNLVRKHIKVERQRWYYWADKLGIMVWQDMPSCNSYTGSPQPIDAAQFVNELTGLVTNHWNSPAIVMWVTFNEGQGQSEDGSYGQTNTTYIVQTVKTLDPYRLVNQASGNNWVGAGDVVDSHSYPNPGNPTSTTQAPVDGEFGGIAWHVAGHLWNASQAGTGYLLASSLDNFADLYDTYLSQAVSYKSTANGGLNAAIYTQITDVENECNGLLTYDRLRKPDLNKIRASNLKAINGAISLTDVLPTSVNSGRTWSYTNSDSTNIPANWYASNFTAPGWSSGQGGFGSSGTSGLNIRTTWGNSNIWLRSWFTLGSLSAQNLSNLVFNCFHDEACEIYINGVLAASATGYTTTYVPMTINAAGLNALIPNSTNLIAVHCNQTYGGQGIDVGIAIQDLSANVLAVPTDYLGYWPLDATTGTVAVDASGNGNNGTVSGAAWSTDGRVNGCLIFNGATSSVQITNPVSIDFSIAFWVKTTQTAGTGQWYYGAGLVDGDAYLVGKDFGTALVGSRFAFGVGNPDTTIVSTNSINDGAWHHCVATRTQLSGAMNLYVDGALQATGTGNTNLLTASTNLFFGRIASGGGYFNGRLDDIQIFNRVLGNNEIAALYDSHTFAPDAPTNLTAMTANSQVTLSWNASPLATSYTVSRSLTPGGTYTAIGSTSTNTYTDSNVVSGVTYYYVVAAANAVGLGSNSAEIGVTPSAVAVAGSLYVDLRASDLATGVATWTNRAGLGNFVTSGTDAPVYTTNQGVVAVQLDGNDGYKGPYTTTFLLSGNAPRTVEAWVNNPSLNDEETMVGMGMRGTTDQNFAFNFGSNAGWGALALYNDDLGWNGNPTANVWHHLVVTYDGTNALLYADGVLKNSAARTAATLVDPIWIGSQTADGVTPANGWLSGYINAIRVHTGVLSASAVTANYALGAVILTPAVPTGLAGVAGNRKISLSWGTVSGAASYNLWRSTDAGASYQPLALGLTLASYEDASAVNGQTNYYQVTAGNSYGVSANSAALGVYLALPVMGMSVNPDALTVSWPAWASDWTLYGSTNLTPPVAWSPVTNAVGSNNGVFNVTLPLGSGVQFFRLVSQ
jgi:predicted alpha-1,6-mannanase (GH76 family)/fibronectin type 3 domain-containing protein